MDNRTSGQDEGEANTARGQDNGRSEITRAPLALSLLAKGPGVSDKQLDSIINSNLVPKLPLRQQHVIPPQAGIQRFDGC